MIGGLVDQAQNAVNKSVDRVIGRAAVAFPLVIATGFLTAAGMIELITLYGAVYACLIAAAVFFVIALITAAFTTNTLAEVEALVTGEPAKEAEALESSAAEDFAKLIGSDPLMALSATTTGFGFLKSFSRRTQITIAIAAVMLVVAVLYLGRRKNAGDGSAAPDKASSGQTPTDEPLAAAA